LAPKELKDLSEHARTRNVDFASTPYSIEEAQFLLTECGVPFIKIASMDINNIRFLECVAKLGSTIILSTGMADAFEISRAVTTIRESSNAELCLLHCVSIYPADASTINLNNLHTLRRVYPDCVIGYSDHTIGSEVAISATALGAEVIEKHFTLDASKIGMDNQMAMEPDQFREMVRGCRRAKESLGSYERKPSEAELAQRKRMRRSIVTRVQLPAGHTLREEDLDFKRPGDGFSPMEIIDVIGKKLACSMNKDEVIYPNMLY
jgi:N-acetylneuraminate synthase